MSAAQSTFCTWLRRSCESLTRVLARLRPGAVVLLHDGGGDRSQTVAALAVLLDALAARGWRSAALCRG